jgi:hypothetical protein
MRKFLIATALALVLLVPPAPAPTRAGTFDVQIPPPVIGIVEADASFTEILGLACVGGVSGSALWFAVRMAEDEVDGGYTGTTATLKDRADKLRAKFGAKSKDAASEDILHLDVDAGAGSTAGAKATMKARATKYVVNPEDIGDLAGTSGKLRVKDKTNKEKLTIDGNIAAKETASGCFISFDDTGTAVSARLDGVKLNGRAIQLRVRR